jgi:hypothetical protein
MPAIIFLTACWLVIPWLATASSLSLPLLLLLLTPPLVVIADRVQP